jgi:uncharacterized membrane protein YbhN (UPF0104 family)
MSVGVVGPEPADQTRRAATPRWGWVRLVGGPLLLVVLVWRIGAGPFVEGLRSVDVAALVAASLIGLVTTACCVWRWRLVARGLQVDVPLGGGMASYYRSQFLNTVLPGGVVGDVHRAVRHGRDVGDPAAAMRAVAWERSVGQGVQAVLTVFVLIALPSPVRPAMPIVVALVGAGVLAAVVALRCVPAGGTSRVARAARTLRADVRDGLLKARTWPGVVLASAVVVAGHAASFAVAARTAGSQAPLAQILALALVVLLAMSIPLNLAGWGPREGVAAWAFAAAGLGAGLGVATAVVYGVMVFVATLPGLLVLIVHDLRRPGRRRAPSGAAPASLTVAGVSSRV